MPILTVLVNLGLTEIRNAIAISFAIRSFIYGIYCFGIGLSVANPNAAPANPFVDWFRYHTPERITA